MLENRKLAAILVTDIVGFSRLTGADEEGTLARLRTLRSEVVEPAIDVHKGRLVKRTGDGSLIEFRSVVEAVRCAIAIQRAMNERNAGVPQERRVDFRMGIHLGDVVEEGDGDLMGDGVNIAARLESISDPGAICISEDAYRQVRARLDLSVTDLGTKSLKNISEPLKVYALEVGSPADPPTGEYANNVRNALDKPSIAVLPFSNMSGDADQEYFVDGMAEDILTALSRFEQLFVIARNSSFVYKGSAVDITQVGRDLGVRYVLEGSARRSGDRIRITGQLIDAKTGNHLWAEKFDGVFNDVFALQDKVTAKVVGALEPTIRKAEIERARRKPVEHMAAYDLYLQALPHVYASHSDANLKALELLTKATDIDPDFSPALAHIGWCLVQRATRLWAPFGDDDVGLAVSKARRVLTNESDDAHSIVLGGFVLAMTGTDYLSGLDAVKRAVEINPGSGFVNAMAGCALVFGDELSDGLDLLGRALDLCPKDPNYFGYLTVTAFGHLVAGAPERALELAQRALAMSSGWDSTYWVLITIYAKLERLDDAKNAAEELLGKHPDVTTTRYEQVLPIRSAEARRLVLDSLQKAGVPS